MNVDYENLDRDLESGMFREMLQEELTAGFRQIQASGERLPLSSHYASQIAEIVSRGAAGPLRRACVPRDSKRSHTVSREAPARTAGSS